MVQSEDEVAVAGLADHLPAASLHSHCPRLDPPEEAIQGRCSLMHDVIASSLAAGDRSDRHKLCTEPHIIIDRARTQRSKQMEHRPRKQREIETCDTPYFRLLVDADGVGYVHGEDGVLVVPLTAEGDVVLAVERSPAFDREVLGLAGGEVEEGESLEVTANRELQEELGWRAQRLDFLGELHPFKYLSSRQFAFLARDLVPSKLEGDELYPVSAHRVPLDSFEELCWSGELRDAPAIAALCLAREFLARETQPGDV